MEKRNTQSPYFKYIAIALVVVILLSAAFLLLEIWESKQGKFSGTGTEYGVLSHDGREYRYKEQIETFLVLGLDRYEDQEHADSHDSGVQADFLMLFVFDNETKQSTAIHINRDTMTKVNQLAVGGTAVVDSYTTQIALAYNYANAENGKIGCRNVKDSVEYLLNGIRIDHYFSLTMEAVPASCDLVGGVELTVLDDFAGIDDTLVKGETINLNGEQALHYVRTRYGLVDSSNDARMARQQQYINAFYDKVQARIEADESFLVKFVDMLDDYVVYDSSDQRMLQFAEKFESYEFLGARELEGELQIGEQYMEFYPDEDSIWDIVLDLFYTEET